MNTQDLLNERQTTHGDFAINASVAQEIREAVRRNGSVWARLHPEYREALDHIAGKIGRVCSAPDPKKVEPDHFADIAGYATLAVNRARKEALPEVTVTPETREELRDAATKAAADATRPPAIYKQAARAYRAFPVQDDGTVLVELLDAPSPGRFHRSGPVWAALPAHEEHRGTLDAMLLGADHTWEPDHLSWWLTELYTK